ncbi:uncharacterized protein Triagg1_4272 [Trichoderma aggressivum f. europaeum]|uniref:Peptidase A2 domain-containing protein n=1 Tax=Trichoderma aggressivum f. europaeum TaxID=173218 RepID=A0AAE1J870_9HYPO|nr:hypothetical protein Triagg1_4272 [Trichoderma aggressivum f. europaeum]
MPSAQPDISKIWVNYLRNSRQFSCAICQVDVKPPTLDGFKQHFRHKNNVEKHPTEEEAILDAFQRMKLTSSKSQYLYQRSQSTEQDQNKGSKKRSTLDQLDDQQDSEHTSVFNAKESSDKKSRNKKIYSPPPSTPIRRGQGRQQVDGNKEFNRIPKGLSIRQLWSPGNRGPQEPSPLKTEPGPVAEAEADDSFTEDPSVSRLIRQLETKLISHGQLITKVEEMYRIPAILVSKCIEVYNAQSANRDLSQQLSNEQRQALIALQSKESELLAAVVKRINDLTVSIKRKHTKDFSSGEKEFYVGGSVNGTVVEALPDTGAEACFISPQLTSRLGLRPIAGPPKWITLANKKTVKSPGLVTVPWKFSKEQITHTINCWILPGCVSDLVLGNDFLKATNALKKVCHRIKFKVLGASKRLSLSYLGNEKQRLRGYLNGHLTAALPDTGSDAMLINGAYARNIGLEVDGSIENRGTIRLADGSTATISGIVRDVEWRVGGTTVQCNFYVLENMCVDIIVSNNYLFEMNIFSEQEEHFFDIHSEDDPTDYRLYFCILSLDKKKDGASSKDCILTLQELKELEKQEELYRRDKTRDEILQLPEEHREAAIRAEKARQQLWEAQKPEREAKWITELHMATANVQNSISRGGRWKKRVSMIFSTKGAG